MSDSVADGAPVSGLVDIHSHLLPGIDDGPPRLEDALEMARAAAGTGIETIVATPHLRADFPAVQVGELADRCEILRAALARERIPLRIITGAEISLAWALEADDQQLELASFGQRGTDLLIETPAANVAGLDRLLYELRRRGFRIILAHPERNPNFQRHPEQLRLLASQGALLQINGDALLNARRKSPVRRLAVELCREGLAHAIASDGHRAAAWRPVTYLPQAAAAAARLVGLDRANWLVRAAPEAIIEGAPLPEQPPARAPTRRPRFLGRT